MAQPLIKKQLKELPVMPYEKVRDFIQTGHILDITHHSLPLISEHSLPAFQSKVYQLVQGLIKLFQSKVYHSMVI